MGAGPARAGRRRGGRRRAGRAAHRTCAALLRRHPPETLQLGLAAFLSRYGHRSVAEIDLGVPRWAEDPTYVLGVLAATCATTTRGSPRTRCSPAVRGRDDGATLTSRAAQRSAVRAAAVGFALRRTRQLAGIRELPKAYVVRALAAARGQLAGVGSELVAAGRLDTTADVFYLDLSEAHRALDGADLRSLVERRREAYDQEMRRRRVPRVLLSDGTEPESAHPEASRAVAGALRGTPASSGTVTGSPGWSSTRWGPGSTPASSSWRRRPTRDGRRCS